MDFKSYTSLFYMITFYVLFSYKILGVKFHRHHYFSFFIIILCLLILFIIYVCQKGNIDLFWKTFRVSVYLLIIMCFYALYDDLLKYYFIIYMDSPYYLMFIIGLISLSLLLLWEFATLIIFGQQIFNGFI